MAEAKGKLSATSAARGSEPPKDPGGSTSAGRSAARRADPCLKLPKKTDAVVCPACMVRMEMDEQHGPGRQGLF